MPGTLERSSTSLSYHGGAMKQWSVYARQWDLLGPPLRPSAEDTRIVDAELAAWTSVHRRAPRALLLGVTPELAGAAWRYDAGTAVTTYYSWNLLVPPGQTSFQWGAPIAGLAPYVPATTDSFSDFHVQLIDLASANGYDQVRAAPEWQWQSPGTATEDGEIAGVSNVAYGAEGTTSIGGIRPGPAR
jgi:hypothetical protein